MSRRGATARVRAARRWPLATAGHRLAEELARDHPAARTTTAPAVLLAAWRGATVLAGGGRALAGSGVDESVLWTLTRPTLSQAVRVVLEAPSFPPAARRTARPRQVQGPPRLVDVPDPRDATTGDELLSWTRPLMAALAFRVAETLACWASCHPDHADAPPCRLAARHAADFAELWWREYPIHLRVDGPLGTW